MPSDDPFKNLEAGLDALESRPKPPTVQEIRDKIKKNQRELIESIGRFNEILVSKKVTVGLEFTEVDQGNHLVSGSIHIRHGGNLLQTLNLQFQGRKYWVHDGYFVKLARREEENGCWNSDEIDDFNNSFSKYIIDLLSKN